MGRKGGLASIFSSKQPKADTPSAPWPWPSCAATPQTASFRRPAGRQRHDDDRWPCTTAGGRHHRASQPDAAGGRLRPPRNAATEGSDDMYKTVNSVYFDATDSLRFFFDDDGGGDAVLDDLDDDDGTFSTTTASEEWSEAVIRSLGRTSTDRFFFDAGGPAPAASNSILATTPSPSPSRPPPPPEAPNNKKLQALSPCPVAAPLVLSDDGLAGDSESEEEDDGDEQPSTSLVEESVAVALDSSDPFGDFRASMAEMVAAHGLRGWPDLQEMLLWYLRINGKHNHALIVGAFVDLLVGLATGSAAGSATAATTTTATTTMTTTTTSASTSTSSSSSSASSSGGDVATAAAAAATMTIEEHEQCGGGSAGASCSSAASSDLEEEDKSSDDDGHCASSGELD